MPGAARPSFWHGADGTGVLLEWAARRLVTFAYAQGAHSMHCVTSGVEGAPALPKAEVIGKGGFGKAPHDDGVGEWSYADVFWSIDGKGRPSVFQLHIVPGSSWQAPLMEMLNFTTDRQLMAWLAQGFRYHADVPPGLRLFPNLQALSPCICKIADGIGDLADAGLYECAPLMNADDAESFGRGGIALCDAACPMHILGGSTVSVSARAKKGTSEMRRIDDASQPHDELYTRERPHGEPDGGLVKSFNELTGAKKSHFDAAKWPREVKWRPRQAYAAMCFLKYAAHVSGVPLVAVINDYRWFFYMFRTCKTEYPFTQMLVVVRLGSVYVYCKVKSKCMGMGFSPASNGGQRFSHTYDEALQRAFKPKHAALLATMPTSLIDLCKDREKLGEWQAFLLWLATYTDDQKLLGLLPFVVAFQDLIEDKAEANGVALCKIAKRQAGTVVEWIGPSYALTPGFGYLNTDKVSRLLLDCDMALHGTIEQVAYESNNGLLVYAKDVLGMPDDILNGIRRPATGLRPHDRVFLTAAARTAYERSVEFVETVKCAPLPHRRRGRARSGFRRENRDQGDARTAAPLHRRVLGGGRGRYRPVAAGRRVRDRSGGRLDTLPHYVDGVYGARDRNGAVRARVARIRDVRRQRRRSLHPVRDGGRCDVASTRRHPRVPHGDG